jgi:hypothetical protein
MEVCLALGAFCKKLRHEKAESLRNRWASLQEQWRETSSNVRMPVRLSFGASLVPRNDNLGEPLLAGTFETNEMHFAGRFLRPGMTVLDVGVGSWPLYPSRFGSALVVQGKFSRSSRPLVREER